MQTPGKWMCYVCITVLLFIVPLSGIVYLDLPLAPYLEFPPKTKYVVHAPFSWPFFILLLVFVAPVCFLLLYRLIAYRPAPISVKQTYPFPWWGWLGVIVVVLFWVLAWNRLFFFEELQKYTFFPLWFGFVLVINGLTLSRKGHCLLQTRTWFFFTLFPLSALFWWYFEYLNRFVQNWYYLGGENISAAEYIIHASICFSTVLPAVLSTYELLLTFPRLSGAFAYWHPVALAVKKPIGWVLLVMATLSLSFLAVFPDYLFPLVWISPLLVIVGGQLVTGTPTIFSGVEKGDWQHVVIPALAALTCGLFWELWNWKSLAHWEYSVPFVHRFQIFEMPLLGYAGYLPFGLECAAVVLLLGGNSIRKKSIFREAA